MEYKFRDFTDEELRAPHPTGVIATLENLTSSRIKQIRELGFNFGISLTALSGDICPASEEAKTFLETKIKRALFYKPSRIWLDHLRFEGHWEQARNSIPDLHKDCEFCKGKDRQDVIRELAQSAEDSVGNSVELGYFAVPFMIGDFNGWENQLGQNPQTLGKIFNFVSPMLYHRMIGKPASYIGEYVQYLDKLRIKAKILPIIQLKDMPDELPDTLSVDEISEAVREAVRSPSSGVAVFSWDQTIEKGKLEGVSAVLKRV